MDSDGLSFIDKSKIKSKYSIPEGFEFFGIVVHKTDTDEFLRSVVIDGDAELRAWVKLPDLALLYSSVAKASEEADRYGRDAIVCYVFESRRQCMVVPV